MGSQRAARDRALAQAKRAPPRRAEPTASGGGCAGPRGLGVPPKGERRAPRKVRISPTASTQSVSSSRPPPPRRLLERLLREIEAAEVDRPEGLRTKLAAGPVLPPRDREALGASSPRAGKGSSAPRQGQGCRARRRPARIRRSRPWLRRSRGAARRAQEASSARRVPNAPRRVPCCNGRHITSTPRTSARPPPWNPSTGATPASRGSARRGRAATRRGSRHVAPPGREADLGRERRGGCSRQPRSRWTGAYRGTARAPRDDAARRSGSRLARSDPTGSVSNVAWSFCTRSATCRETVGVLCKTLSSPKARRRPRSRASAWHRSPPLERTSGARARGPRRGRRHQEAPAPRPGETRRRRGEALRVGRQRG